MLPNNLGERPLQNRAVTLWRDRGGNASIAESAWLVHHRPERSVMGIADGSVMGIADATLTLVEKMNKNVFP